MAETRSEEEECALPAKRKPDLTCPNADDDPPTKAPKTGDVINGGSHADGGAETVPVEVNGAGKIGEVADASVRSGVDLEEEEDQEEIPGFELDEDDEEDDEDYGDEDGQRVVDVKGKGILKDDKGKGKLIVEEDDDGSGDSNDGGDSDDSDSSDSDGDAQSGSDSDLSDDPLAEVDLDNILPSRTRRSRAQPGVVIGGDRSNTDGSSGGCNA